MQDFVERSKSIETHMIGLQATFDTIQEQLVAHRKTMQEWENQKAHFLKCNAVLDKLVQEVSANGVGKVESVVTQGLQLVFGPQVSCFLERRDMAKGTTYSIKLRMQTPEGEVIGDPMDSFGGGPVNLISFLMRVLMVHRFKLAKLMILDESFNNVSRGHLDAVSMLLKTLTEEHNYSILAITHQPELTAKADNVYAVGGVLGSPTLSLLSAGDGL